MAASTSERTTLSTKLLFLITWLVILGSVWYLLVSPGVVREKLFPPAPCRQPVHYSFGEIDPRFYVSTSTLEKVVSTAAELWSAPVGKPLFVYDPRGSLTINLMYDDRQAARDKIKQLGLSISDDKASYDALRAKYNALKATLVANRQVLQAQVKDYNAKAAAFDTEVRAWNAKGGAPPKIYAELQQQKEALDAQAARIKQGEAEANVIVDQINAMVTVLNRMAAALNFEAVQANAVNRDRGETFEEGEYRVDTNGRAVNIYEFETRAKLTRVMAHELGHALGLEHVNDPAAIMYYLNQGNAEKLSATDVVSIKALCGVN